ncbi:MAG TPA: arylamine N-acetyltransferase [Anaeromyxobacter sp.]|nr:arylamine N-acetyltransferase [Anaeromyxobacter sp.]
MTREQLARFLRLVGVAARRPSLDALGELLAAHLSRVPFENVSKLYRLRRSGLADVPDLETHLDGIERLRLGGTCYANAFHLNDLLLALGYRARLCGADMSRPDVHVVNVVELDGRELLVDVGYGAPLFAPMPLDLDRVQVVELGRDRYVLRPRGADGGSALEHHRDGALRHGYRVRPAPRARAHFGGAIADSFRPDATFMNAVVIIRFSAGRARVLRNLSLALAHGEREERRSLADGAELVRVAEEVFGVPPEVTAEAIAAVPDLGAEFSP